MKVLVFGPTIDPVEGAAGSAIGFRTFIEVLRKVDFVTIHVITTDLYMTESNLHELKKAFGENFTLIETISLLNNLFKSPILFPKKSFNELYKIVENNDVIYIRSFWNVTSILIFIMAFKKNKVIISASTGKLAAVAHLEKLEKLSNWRKIFHKLVTSNIVSKSNFIHYANHEEYENSSNNCAGRGFPIYMDSAYPYDLWGERKAFVRKEFDNKLINVAIVGRISPLKNIHGSINYINDFIGLNSHLCAHIKIIGWDEDPSYKKLLKDLLNKLPNNISYDFAGALKRKEVLDELSKSDVLVHLSESEGVSNVTMESLAVGTPVVVTEGGNIKERTGLLVIPKDEIKSKKYIEKLSDILSMNRKVIQNDLEADFGYQKRVCEYVNALTNINF